MIRLSHWLEAVPRAGFQERLSWSLPWKYLPKLDLSELSAQAQIRAEFCRAYRAFVLSTLVLDVDFKAKNRVVR